MPTLADRRISQMQQVTGETRSNLTDLEWDFYSVNSGLSPANKYSISDHKLAYFKLQGAAGKSLPEVEKAFFTLMGAQGANYDDLALNFYTNLGFGPGSISGLAAWYDASSISSTVIAKDSFDRSKNLLAANDPSYETGAYAGVNANSTASRDTATVRIAGTAASEKVVSVAAGNTGIFTGPTKTVQAGVTQTHSTYVFSNATRSITIAVDHLNTGSYLTTSLVIVTVPANTWVRLSVTYTTVANTNQITPYVLWTAVAAGETVNVDDTQIEVGSQPTPFVWGDATHLGVSDSGHVWTLLNGGATTGVSGGKAVTTGNISIAIDAGTPDVDISVLMPTIGPGTNDCVIFRVTDLNNNYRITQSQLYKVVAGVPTALGGHTQTFTAGDIMRVTAVGTTLTVYRNGNQVNQLTDATYTTQTKQGAILDTNFSQIDNFTVSTPIYSDGAALPIWPDISGNYRHALQATGTKRPLFRTALTAPTGKPVVQFDGVDDDLDVTINGLTLVGTANTGFDVFKLSATGVSNVVIGGDGDTTIAPYGSAASTFSLFDSGAAISTGASDTSWHTLGGQRAGAASVIDKDSTLAAGSGTTNGPTTITAMRIGNNISRTGAFNGQVAAILVFNRALSTNERQRVERYLKARYGTP